MASLRACLPACPPQVAGAFRDCIARSLTPRGVGSAVGCCAAAVPLLCADLFRVLDRDNNKILDFDVSGGAGPLA